MSISTTYLGKEVVAGNDDTQDVQNMPAGTNRFWVDADGGPVYVAINDDAATDDASGVVPQEGTRYFGPYNNITSIGIYAATGVSAYLRYEG